VEVVSELFFNKINIPADVEACWEWTAHRCKGGYGRFNSRMVGTGLAHRISYMLLVGPIPEDKELDHLCRNKGCVNPMHLEPVAHRENCRRGMVGESARRRNLAKKHCLRGHLLDVDNTYIDGKGKRSCLACRRLAAKRYRERRRLK
jgi:hypothetical protein